MSNDGTAPNNNSGVAGNVTEDIKTEIVHVGRPWLGIAIACAVIAAILAFLLIPGVLLYPRPPRAEDELVEAQRRVNAGLEERAQQLRRLKEQAFCSRDGQFFQRSPNGIGIKPLDSALQPPLPRVDSLQATPDAVAPGSSVPSLVSLMDHATALVIAPAGEGVEMGSGFFVAPGKLLTNRHVVEGARGQITVFNRDVSAPMPATVVKKTDNSDFGHPDFALLDVPAASHQPFLSVARTAERLQPVIAAGFPGLITETDERFHRLMSGDFSSVPEVSFTDGIVTARQSGAGADLILHSAAISPGNSGGPLIDRCGRVVGVNTFVRAEETYQRMNYALASDSVVAFLHSAGVEARTAGDACTAPPPAVSSGTPAPDASSSAPAAAPATTPAPAASTPAPTPTPTPAPSAKPGPKE